MKISFIFTLLGIVAALIFYWFLPLTMAVYAVIYFIGLILIRIEEFIFSGNTAAHIERSIDSFIRYLAQDNFYPLQMGGGGGAYRYWSGLGSYDFAGPKA
jgi:hypothetical protein